jgi:nicotinamide-nucleotide amidase
MVQVAEAVADQLGGRQVAIAESCTAGRIASTLACVDHAVDFLRGGVVAYQRGAKESLLGLTASSVLSECAAQQMARGACQLFDATVGLATTGLAGGEPEDGVAVGTVFIATCIDGHVASSEYCFNGSPQEVCEAASLQGLVDLVDALDATNRR